MKWNELTRKLKKDGWSYERDGKGSHEIWSHPTKPGKITVSMHGAKEVGTGLAKSIMKDAGLK